MYENILVPIDGSEQSIQATDHALEIARQFGSTVHALYVIDDRYAERASEMMGELSRDSSELQEIKEHRENLGNEQTSKVVERAHEVNLDAEHAVLSGDPADVITEYAKNEKIDLIVIGARGRSAVGKFLMGDVAGKVARHATTPVMLVRTDK